MFAGYLSQYLEGEPEIVVENVPGGGQKEGLNQFERSDHEDGLTLAMASGGIIASTLFDKEGIQFNPGDYETLVAFGGGMTVYGSVAAGIDSLEDLVTQETPVYYGGMELNASESVRVFALDELGISSFEPLMGYDGGGSITAAVLRGELSAGNSTSSHYLNNVLPLEEDGEITPLMTQGYVEDGEVVRDPAFPELPTMPEAYETLTGQSADGTGWDIYRAVTTAQTNLLRNYWIHGDAADEAKAALHKAVAQVVIDEDFLDEAAKLLGEEPPVQLGEEANASLAAARDLTPEQVQWVEDYIAEVSTR
jgi:tripartite-type tricarboxylate transporter receptor subunit TctC